jgi:hypothetical protein
MGREMRGRAWRRGISMGEVLGLIPGAGGTKQNVYGVIWEGQ